MCRDAAVVEQLGEQAYTVEEALASFRSAAHIIVRL